MTNPLIDNYSENVALQKDDFNPLTPYNYGGNTAFVPLSSVMKIDVDSNDKLLSLIDNKLSSSIDLKFEDGNLMLLGKNDEVIGQVSLPLDHFLKEAYYDAETKELVFVFDTSTGEKTARVNVSDLVDTYTAGNGLKLSDNEFSIDETVVGTKEDIKTINDNLVLAINTLNKNMADGFNTINGGIENEIKPEIAKKVDWTDIHTEEYPERKAIVLANHDMLLGSDTTGGTYNLAMVSKWDVADYGTPNLLTNINSKERPTVQLPGVSGEDAEKIAFLSDIPSTENLATKEEVAAVDSKFGDRFLSGATVSEAITNIEGNLEGEVSLREQADKDLSAKIDKTKSELETADSNIAQNLQGVSDRVTALETGATGSTVIEELKSDVETLKTDSESLKSDVSTLELNKVDWTDIHTEEYPERKAIVLANHDMLLGSDTTGGTYNLAMVNKWGVADYGTSNLLANINSKERPTVQLPGVSGEDAEKIAFLSDIPNMEDFATKEEVASKISGEDVLSNLSLSSTTDSLHYELSYLGTSLGQIAIPEDQFLESVEYIAKATEDDRKIEPSIVIVGDPYLKFVFRITGNKKVYTYIPIKSMVSDLATKDEVNSTILSIISDADSFKTTILDKFEMLEGKLNSLIFDEAETVESYDGTQELNDASKSYVISDANITNSSNIVAKNVTMDNAELSNNARMSVQAKDVTFNSLNVSGDFPKANGNAVVKVNEAEYVIFKDMTFDSSNVYNGIEIGLTNSATTLPKNVIFENCKFTGTFTNNAILIFATQDNAIITLSNCQFDKVSNVLRLSNRTNAKNITVNVVNCSVAQWDTNQYAGFLICQDYTSSTSDVETNNLFGDNKISVNFINLTHKGSKVLPTDVSSVCGTGTVDQVVYVYTDANGAIIPYSADKYPVIKFS